jgi:predicted GNAT superfamily acetyltransferase
MPRVSTCEHVNELPDTKPIVHLVHNNTLDLRVGEVTAASELAAASELYRGVFGYTKPEASLNPRLLMAMAANGGSAVGAWNADDLLVAFGYGFAGFANGEHYFYSQAVVVADSHQGTGLGRRIKREQRRVALAKDLHRMRWAFDPRLARNAHFNLSVLGAVGRWFVPDCYGDGESRMVVEWDLDAPATFRPLPWTGYDTAEWGHPHRNGDLVAVPLPADRRLVEPAITARIDDALDSVFADGLCAVSCVRQDQDTAVYVFGEVRR